MPDRTLRTGALARVEGEGAMEITIRDGVLQDVQLRIYEPPRFFEAFLRGRAHTEPPDLTSRICGICPVAYQLSACAAIEDACGVQVEEPVRLLRRLLYCGEWIQSHTLHIFLLHAPDFLGYESGLAMAADHREAVELGLALKKLGNRLMECVGGRAVHPINVRVGGFHRAPEPRELLALRDPLERAREQALEAVRFVAGLPFPELEIDYEFVALRQPGEYPLERGQLHAGSGLELAPHEFADHFDELQVPHSNALHCLLDGTRPYLTGPLARYALNRADLSPPARDAAAEAGLGDICRNPFRSIVVRAVEVLYAIDEALRIVDAYEPPERAAVAVEPRAATGHGWTEAPRGMLYHAYTLDADGVVLDARIVPPTSQNQATIEADLRTVVSSSLDLPDAELGLRCEQAIRNHDPCISCATHFLQLTVDRR